MHVFDWQVDSDVDIEELAQLSENFSGSDIKESCRLAAMCRVREILQQHDLDGESALYVCLNLLEFNVFNKHLLCFTVCVTAKQWRAFDQ